MAEEYTLTEALAAAEKALRRVEFAPFGNTCPVCGCSEPYVETYGHYSGCLIGQALRAISLVRR
jgi:hypothetical protein